MLKCVVTTCTFVVNRKITVVFFITGPIVGSPSTELMHAKRQILNTPVLNKRIDDEILKFKSGISLMVLHASSRFNKVRFFPVRVMRRRHPPWPVVHRSPTF